MNREHADVVGRVGPCLEAVDVERVLPQATSQEKRLRFAWEQRPSAAFLMNWNFHMEPNQMFVEELDEHGLTVTVRWGLMTQPPAQVAEVINRWLAKCETGTYKKSGDGGRRLL